MKRVCMIVQDRMVKGGIAAVVSGYYGSQLEKDFRMTYVESYRDGSKLAKLCKGIGSYFRFAWILMTDRPELVHIHSSFGPSFYRKLPFICMASWADIPVVNHIHGADFESFYTNANEKKKAQIRRVYSKCSALIALSEEWKEKLSQIVPAEKITVIENYSILHEDALKDRLNRESNRTVLFLGELGRRKGCYDIPEVAAEVAKEIPDVRFVLAGAGSAEDEAAIRKLCQDLGVEKNVVFPGWVRGEEKGRLLREADVFFLPSYNEGMPMSILDAMGYGLPVVSTNVGGIPQTVQDGRNGSCHVPGNVAGMCRDIVEILNSRDTRIAFSKESFRISWEKYGLQAHLFKLAALYKSVYKKSR